MIVKEIKTALDELKEGAEELINLGDSIEKARGSGMLDVINMISRIIESAAEQTEK